MSIPAGWYDDGNGSKRWWDGTTWSEHLAPAATPAPVAPSSEPIAPKRKSRGGLIAGLILVVLVLVGGGLAAAFFLFRATPGGAETAEEAAELPLVAMFADDCEEASSYVHDADDDVVSECEEALAGYADAVDEAQVDDDMTIDVVDSEEDGDEATVTLEFTVGDFSRESNVAVELIDDRWYLADEFGDIKVFTPTGASTPAEVMDVGFTAFIAGDCETAITFVFEPGDTELQDCEQAHAEVVDQIATWGEDAELEIVVTDTEEDGDVGTVYFDFVIVGEVTSDFVDVEKHNGRWYFAEGFGPE